MAKKEDVPKIQDSAEFIGQVKINDFRKIVIALSHFRNKPRIDMREYVDTNYSQTDPNWIPTKKGLSMPVEIVGEIYKLFKKAIKPWIVEKM